MDPRKGGFLHLFQGTARPLRGMGTESNRHLQDAYCTELPGDNRTPEICL